MAGGPRDAEAREGRIREVMETWPLQVVLEGREGPVSIQLPEAGRVRHADGSPAALRHLRPGVRIRVEGAEITLLDGAE